MGRLRLQIRLFVCLFYYGISLVHVYAYGYAYLNVNPHSHSHPARTSGRSFLPQRAAPPSVSHRYQCFYTNRHSHSHSHLSVLFSAPIDGDNNVPIPSDADAPLDPSSLSLQDLIARLDERNIRYSPTSTRKEMEALLLLEQPQAQTEAEAETGASQSAVDPLTKHPPSFDEVSASAPQNQQKQSQSRRQQRPIQDMLRELDSRNIRYPPTASRDDLKWLLENHHHHPDGGSTEKQKQKQKDNHVSSSSAKQASNSNRAGSTSNANSNANSNSNSNMNKTNPRTSQAKNKLVPIADLFRKLDERNIRYSPAATRLDLEELLERDVATSAQLQDSDSDRSQQRKPLVDVLLELDARNIRFSPTATRRDLEELLESTMAVETQDDSQQRQRRRQQQTESPQPIETELGQQQKYPAPEDADEEKRQQTRRAQRRAKLQKQQDRSPWRRILRKSQSAIPFQVWDALPRKIASTTSRATRKAQRVSRQAAELFTVNIPVDEDGVRDVDYEYLYKEERISPKPPVDVTAQRITTATEEREPYRQRQRRATRDTGTTPPLKRRQRERDRPARSRPVGTRSSRGVSPPNPPPQNLQTGLLLLPSTKLDGSSKPVSPKSEEREPRKPPRSARREASSKRSKRRIYSPYKEESNPLDNRDVLDRFGDFFADTADRVLWDDYDNSATPKNGSKNKSAASAGNKTEPIARHWKDRLEERFDSMLGIHEDGAYYNKWAKQEAEDRRTEGGNDAFSVAQGRKPKTRGVFGRRRVYDKPIWEEEGNLISLLFGRSSSGGSLLFERLLDHNSGSLLNLFESVFRSFLLVASYLCRWATVRGAIPQPLVVFGLISAGICARPRRRLRTIAITLLALRTAGELVHGYVYGEQGWEDEEDYEDENVDLQGGEGERV